MIVLKTSQNHYYKSRAEKQLLRLSFLLGERVRSMNTVEPIRESDKVEDVMDILKKSNDRDYVLFLTGIYTGLRISDILQLKVRDVRDQDFIRIIEKKTGKERRFPIHRELKRVFHEYIPGKEDYEYLFKSRQCRNKPISRMRAYQVLNQAAGKLGLKNIGTHTMRKTFGYFLYQQTKDLAAIKTILNHSDMSYTLRYIGIAQEKTNEIIKQLTFKK
jgi:integrase